MGYEMDMERILYMTSRNLVSRGKTTCFSIRISLDIPGTRIRLHFRNPRKRESRASPFKDGVMSAPTVVRRCADGKRGRGFFATRAVSAGEVLLRDTPLVTCPSVHTDHDGILVCDLCRQYLGSIQLQLHVWAGDVCIDSVRSGLRARAALQNGSQRDNIGEISSSLEPMLSQPRLPDVPGRKTKLSEIYATGRVPGALFCSKTCADVATPAQMELCGRVDSMYDMYETDEDESLTGDEKEPESRKGDEKVAPSQTRDEKVDPAAQGKGDGKVDSSNLSIKSDEKTASTGTTHEADDDAMSGLTAALAAIADSECQRHLAMACIAWLWARGNGSRITLLQRLQGALYWETGLGDAKQRAESRKNCETIQAALASIPGGPAPTQAEFGVLAGTAWTNALEIRIPSPLVYYCLGLDGAKEQHAAAIEAVTELVRKALVNAGDELDDKVEEGDEMVRFIWPNLAFESSVFPIFQGGGLYSSVSMANHSCAPNCEHTFTESAQVMLFVGRGAQKGEELTISYIGECEQDAPTSSRRAELAESFGFYCMCPACKRPAPKRPAATLASGGSNGGPKESVGAEQS